MIRIPSILSSLASSPFTDVHQYDTILNEYRTASTSNERNTALRALGRAKAPALIKRTLALPLGEEVKSQDIYLPLSGLRTHEDGVNALWAWMKDNWSELERKLPPSLTMLSTVVSICTSSFTHEDHMRDIQDFFGKRKTQGFDQSLAQSLDSIRAKSRWLKRDSGDVEGWLKEKGYL